MKRPGTCNKMGKRQIMMGTAAVFALLSILLVAPAGSQASQAGFGAGHNGRVTSPDQNVQAPACDTKYAGIELCRIEDNAYYVKVDLADPHIRIETVMANDILNVNPGSREYVEDMAKRHIQDGAVVAINADYFGAGHGAEGFTVVNGNRLDGADNGDADENSFRRSSLVFSQSQLDGGRSPITASIQRFNSDKVRVDPGKIFNAVGGGPQIMFDGVWQWLRGRGQDPFKDYPECPLDVADKDVINGECFGGTGDWNSSTKEWTVVGKDSDGRLFLLVAPYPLVQSTLESQGVQQAIKLDGGGSSQLWYDKNSLVGGRSRAVADGLLVFCKDSFSISQIPKWPIILPGQSLDIKIILRNTGANTWTPGVYWFTTTNNPWHLSRKFDLAEAVEPGEETTLTWHTDPIDKEWGVYAFSFRLMDHGTEFDDKSIQFMLVVIPQKLADKKIELEQKIRDWIDQGVEDLEQKIIAWITSQLQNWLNQCLQSLGLIPLVLILVGIQRRSLGK